MTAFNFDANVTTFDGRVKSAQAFALDVANAQGSLASVFLSLAVYNAAASPDISNAEAVDRTVDQIGNKKAVVVSLIGQYVSLAKNALKTLRSGAGFPVFDGSTSEPVRLKMVDRFCKGKSLRALSDGVTSLRADAASLRRDEAKAEATTRETAARDTVGMGKVGDLSVVALLRALAPWQTAAKEGNVNARALLASVIVTLTMERDGYAAADAALAKAKTALVKAKAA